MGFHVCQFCQRDRRTPAHSSGDSILSFTDGAVYQVPDMLPHYVLEHNYKPPQEFIARVIKGGLQPGSRFQTKAIAVPLGYLQDADHDTWKPEEAGIRLEFLGCLSLLLRQATDSGDRRRTRGVSKRG